VAGSDLKPERPPPDERPTSRADRAIDGLRKASEVTDAATVFMNKAAKFTRACVAVAGGLALLVNTVKYGVYPQHLTEEHLISLGAYAAALLQGPIQWRGRRSRTSSSNNSGQKKPAGDTASGDDPFSEAVQTLTESAELHHVKNERLREDRRRG
jgi:hypothetical protein